MRLMNLALVCVLLAACSKDSGGPSKADKRPEQAKPAEVDATSRAAPAKPKPKQPVVKRRVCDQAPGWRYERIELPPAFAPTMARGREELFFAPGMFKPKAPSYFSYVFSLVFEQARTFDAASMRALLNTYYRGLMSAVAKGKKLSLDPSTIDSKVIATRPIPSEAKNRRLITKPASSPIRAVL